MDFKYAIPIITDRKFKELTKFLEIVDPKQIEISALEEILGQMGQFLVAGCALPTILRDWLDNVPQTRIILCRVTCTGIISNANFIMAKRVEQASFALVAIIWIQEEGIFIHPNLENNSSKIELDEGTFLSTK